MEFLFFDKWNVEFVNSKLKVVYVVFINYEWVYIDYLESFDDM